MPMPNSKKKKTIFGNTEFGIQDVADSTASNLQPEGSAQFSQDEANVLLLASEFGVAVPQLPLAQMTQFARADAFNGIEAALKKVMMDSGRGREMLGASLIEPLREEQDYQSQLRKMFKPFTLGAGQENWIPLDINVQAFVVAMDGETVSQTPYGLEGVEVPLQKIDTKIMFHITDIRKGKFDLVSRAKEKAESEVFKKEDKSIANLLAQVSASGKSNAPILVSTVDFKSTGLYTIIDAVSSLEGQEGKTLNAVSLWANPYWKQVFRKVNNYKDGFQVSFNTADELTRRGIIAEFQGLSINMSAVIPTTHIYITAEPETFGAFVESMPLMVIDTVDGASVGFIILEEVGFIVTNPKALSTIVVG